MIHVGCGYSFEPPRLNVLSKHIKIIDCFSNDIFNFNAEKIPCILHGQVVLNHSVYPSVCRTDGYGTDRRLQEHALFRAKNVFPFF